MFAKLLLLSVLASAHADTAFKVDNVTIYRFNFLKPIEMPVSDQKDMFSLSYKAYFQNGKLLYAGGTSVYQSYNLGNAMALGLSTNQPYCEVTFYLPASLVDREEASKGTKTIVNRIEPGTSIDFGYGGQYQRVCVNSECFVPAIHLKSSARMNMIGKEIKIAGDGTLAHSSYVPKIGDGVAGVSCSVGDFHSGQQPQNITTEMVEGIFPAGSLKIEVK